MWQRFGSAIGQSSYEPVEQASCLSACHPQSLTLEPDANGIIKSEVFPGLWLAVPALIQGNLAEVLTVLQSGLNSSEHADFVRERSDSFHP